MILNSQRSAPATENVKGNSLFAGRTLVSPIARVTQMPSGLAKNLKQVTKASISLVSGGASRRALELLQQGFDGFGSIGFTDGSPEARDEARSDFHKGFGLG
jgi:hypothetical protein